MNKDRKAATIIIEWVIANGKFMTNEQMRKLNSVTNNSTLAELVAYIMHAKNFEQFLELSESKEFSS